MSLKNTIWQASTYVYSHNNITLNAKLKAWSKHSPYKSRGENIYFLWWHAEGFGA